MLPVTSAMHSRNPRTSIKILLGQIRLLDLQNSLNQFLSPWITQRIIDLPTQLVQKNWSNLWSMINSVLWLIRRPCSVSLLVLGKYSERPPAVILPDRHYTCVAAASRWWLPAWCSDPSCQRGNPVLIGTLSVAFNQNIDVFLIIDDLHNFFNCKGRFFIDCGASAFEQHLIGKAHVDYTFADFDIDIFWRQVSERFFEVHDQPGWSNLCDWLPGKVFDIAVFLIHCFQWLFLYFPAPALLTTLRSESLSSRLLLFFLRKSICSSRPFIFSLRLLSPLLSSFDSGIGSPTQFIFGILAIAEVPAAVGKRLFEGITFGHCEFVFFELTQEKKDASIIEMR